MRGYGSFHDRQFRRAEQEIWSRGTALTSSSEGPDRALVGFLVRRAAMVRSGVPVVVRACPATPWPAPGPSCPLADLGKADQRPTR